MADFDEAPAPPLSPDDEKQLWDELAGCVSSPCDSHESLDDALRTWLDLTMRLRHRSHEPQDEVVACAQMLVESQLFRTNRDYVRKQIIHSLLQEDEAATLHAIACLLLLDGHIDKSAFPRLIDEACFPRLLDLIKGRPDDDPLLQRLLLRLMYEMSRIERLRVDDLLLVDDPFIHHLFRIIEGVSDDVDDPYHYPTIRVLLVLNEQYMLASTDSAADPASESAPLTNRIVKCLSLHGPSFRTFGENLILLLNRETETSLQLLILKLLYLLCTTRATYEYFYTNDLRVLLDVIIRNLMDLPDEKMALRHTYLRVLYPLLAHTQLNQPPHYKHDEVLRLLKILRGSQNAHFAPADETTLRLVERVAKVKWLEEAEQRDGSGEAEVAQKLLGISLSPAQAASSVSVVDIAAVTEKPGVQTPSRTAGEAETDGSPVEEETTATVAAAIKTKKPLPAVPKHRHGTPFTQLPKIHINGPAKKVPPKTPPPRRWGKMKTAAQPPIEPIQETGPDREA